MIKAYLNDDLIINRFQSFDQWKSPAATINLEIKCRIDWTTRRVRDINGIEVEATATIIIAHDLELTHKDMITIGGVKYAIINIMEKKDFSAQHHEIYIK